MNEGEAAFWARMEAAVALHNERVRTCHERVACPKCGAPAGHGCVKITTRALLKHSHDERLRADGIASR